MGWGVAGRQEKVVEVYKHRVNSSIIKGVIEHVAKYFYVLEQQCQWLLSIVRASTFGNKLKKETEKGVGEEEKVRKRQRSWNEVSKIPMAWFQPFPFLQNSLLKGVAQVGTLRSSSERYFLALDV